MKRKLILIAIFVLMTSLGSTLPAKDYRRVDLTWDNTATTTPFILKFNNGKNEISPYAYTPEEDDSLTVHMTTKIETNESISVEHQFVEISSKDFTVPISNVFNANVMRVNSTSTPKTVSKQITDIRSNSWLIIKFIKTDKDGTKTILAEINYRTEEKFTRFFTATGIAAYIQPDTSIVIENTLVKNEQKIMEYQKVLKEKNASSRFRMAQSFYQFLHFIPFKSAPLAISLGLPLSNIKIYEDPYFGLSLFIKYKNNAVIFTGGVHFHKNITIAKNSGFEPTTDDKGKVTYFLIDPKNQIDIADIPKDENTVLRLFFAISFKL